MALTIFSTIALLALGFAVKLAVHDWLHPAVLFALVWAFNCIVALLLAPENIVSATGPLWILLNAVLVAAGAVIGSIQARSSYGLRARQQRPETLPLPASNRKLRRLTLTCTLLGIAYVLIALHLQGIGISQLISPREVVKIAAQMSTARYSGKAETSKVAQLLLAVAYLAPMLGGTLMVRAQRFSHRILSLFTLLPGMATFFLESTKSAVLWGVIMWTAGYFTTRVSFGRTMPRVRLSHRQVVLVLSILPLLVGLIVAGDSLRHGAKSKAAKAGAELIGERAKTYLGGHIAALSYLIDTTDLDAMAPHPGRFTLAGINDLIHPGTRLGGVTGYAIYIPSGMTNIFTYFWDLIWDYSAPGSLVVIFVLAMGSGFAYRKVAEQNLAWNGVLGACYSTMFCGFTCMFNYNSVILAFTLYGLACARPWKMQGEPAWGE